MDNRDFLAINKQIETEVQIIHPLNIVSFSHIDSDTQDLYNYCFMFKNGTIKIHSIDRWKKNSKSGSTYKREEVFL